jgi:hypothetical protein
MSDHIDDAGKMVCPHCGLPEDARGSQGGIWFECGSKHDERRTAFCKEREPLWRELSNLRTANAALVEEVARLQDECRIAILRAERAEERVKRLEAWGDRLEELLGEPPAANCYCHISPPCDDCVNWAAIREAKTEWSQAKAAS